MYFLLTFCVREMQPDQATMAVHLFCRLSRVPVFLRRANSMAAADANAAFPKHFPTRFLRTDL